MSTAKKLENKKYSYADYLSFPDEERVEIIDGIVYNMSPSPRKRHQEISGNLFLEIGNYLKGKKCSIFSAPFDVVFTEKRKHDSEVHNVVQPDLSIICDKNKLDEFGCKGAPDWIIEILSPSTSSKDLNEKFYLYEKYGVKEYWIVEPKENIVLIYVLNEKRKYENTARLTTDHKAKSTIFEDLSIDLAEIFDD